MIPEVVHQRRTIGLTAIGVAQGVQLKGDPPAKPKRLQHCMSCGDDLYIAQRVGNAQQLHADLVELPEPAFLGPLVAEHGPGVEVFERQFLAQPAR